MRYFLLCFLFLVISCYNDDDYLTEKTIAESEISSKDFIIAHRGCWEYNIAPQNSRESLKRALALNIYGTEFDVRQTKDGLLVVNHDDIFNGLAIAQSTYLELCQYALSNGETLPLLEDFLDIKNKSASSVKLIVELKSCIVSDVVSLINQYSLQQQVEYISFSKSYCLQLVNMGYGNQTYYLSGNFTPAEIKEFGIGGIDYENSVFVNHPTYIDESKELGLKTIVWTVNNVNSVIDYISKGVIVTTDNPAKFVR